MYNRQLDSEMADTQVTQRGKTMDTAMQVRNKHLRLAVNMTAGDRRVCVDVREALGFFNHVHLLFSFFFLNIKSTETTNEQMLSLLNFQMSWHLNLLKCDATHSSVYGCDSGRQSLETLLSYS